MTTATLFDYVPRKTEIDAEKSAAERDAGIAQAEAAALQEFKDRALEACRQVCRKNNYFIIDAVWEEMGEYTPPPGFEARSMGGIIRKAANLGYCRATTHYKPSAQVNCHSNPRREWQSAIFEGEAS